MKRIVLIILLALLAFAAAAQSAISATVNVESAFARVAPAFDAEPSASLFEDERVEIVGRNLNGLWFLVQRPYRMNTLGWVFHELLDYDLKPETLPLADITTGVVGPTPLTEVTPYGGYLLAQVYLRESPTRTGAPIRLLPALRTVPIVARNSDASWLKVNYLGYEGWVSGFTFRSVPNVMDIPEAQGIPPSELPPLVVIPIEIQQAHIDQLREFATARREYAYNLELFWWSVFRGEIMPCNPPAEISEYPYTQQDVQELPELGRYIPQLTEAVRYVNSAVTPLERCGVIRPDDVYSARNSAINAKVIFDATLQRLDVLEDEINQRRGRRVPTPTPEAP